MFQQRYCKCYSILDSLMVSNNSHLNKVLFLMQNIIQAYVMLIFSFKCTKIWIWFTKY
jgi:hypothetical protein